MVRSLESTRPIMSPSVASNRASKRFSTISTMAPSVAGSDSTISTQGDARIQEIKEFSQNLERLNSTRLQAQRYQPSAEKTEYLSKLALGAKVERALERRMTSQDAIYRPRQSRTKEAASPATVVLNEKTPVATAKS